MTECLSEFVSAVQDEVRRLIEDDRLPVSQRSGLQGTMDRCFAWTIPSDWAQPLGLLYATYRGLGRATDAQTVALGAFCALYLASADLFDDLQDDDMAGRPLEAAGPAVAMNSALALLVIALSALQNAMQLERDAERRVAYLDVFNRAALVAVGAQHSDLVGLGDTNAPAAVLAMNRAKTSSVALVTECGALLAGADMQTTALFRAFGNDFSALVQIVDDVRDIFGKAESPDLRAGKITYPIACFLENAQPIARERFEALRAELPASEDALRELLYEGGGVHASAAAVQDLRTALHRRLTDVGSRRAELRMLLTIVDTLSATLFEPEPVPETTEFFAASGPFHDDIRRSARQFASRLGVQRTLALPTFVPWEQPLFLFDPKHVTIHYPDLDGLEGEIVSRFAGGLPLDRAATLLAIARGMPLLVAHELFHAWRLATGRLSSDAWHEEFVANRLAMGYALRFEPEAAQATVEFSRLILDRVPRVANEADLQLLAREQGGPLDYELGLADAARIHAKMLLDASVECDFEADRMRWLSQVGDSSTDEPVAAE
jgi:geranylgeranyl pyrophosphate synthase